MKFTFLLFVLLAMFTGGETARVTFVKGLVKTKTGRAVRVNDALKTDETVELAPNAILRFRTKKGTFFVKADELKPVNGKRMLALNKATTAQKINVEGKRGEILANYQALQKYFSGNGSPNAPKPFLVIGTGKYTIAIDDYTQNENNFFVINYNYKGEVINKKLNYEGKQLILDKSVFTVEGNPINPDEVSNIKLNFYRATEGTMTFITQMHPVIVEKDLIAEEIKAIVSETDQTTPLSILEEVMQHLLAVYGEPDEVDVKKILTEQHNLKF